MTRQIVAALTGAWMLVASAASGQLITPEELEDAMRRAGFREARYESLTGGIACLHVARK